MTKEEFAKFHYLLAIIKYDYAKRLFDCEIEFRDDIEEIIKAIELLEKICIFDK